MSFIHVDEDNFDAVLEREFANEKVVILKFESHYNDACQVMQIELEELCDRLTNISVLNIDSGVCTNLSQRYFIEEVPTTLIFKTAEKQLFYRAGVALADDMINAILKDF